MIAVVIVVGTWSLLKDRSTWRSTPCRRPSTGAAIETYLKALPGVSEIHDLHIWAMSTTEVALTAHLVRPGATLDDGLLAQACRDLSSRFGIAHATLQIEVGRSGRPSLHAAPA